MKKSLILIILLFCWIKTPAQNVFQWNGLTIGTTTASETSRLFGKPKKDGIEEAKFDKSLPEELKKQMVFRKFYYEKINEFDEIYLLFLNEKLLGIDLSPQKRKMQFSNLEKMTAAQFIYFGEYSDDMNLAANENIQIKQLPKVFPRKYLVFSIKTDHTIIAQIENPARKSDKSTGTENNNTNKFPGFVKNIKVMSRGFN